MERNNANMDQIPDGPPQQARVSAKEFAAKYQSKRECYTFVAVECGIYVPPYGKSLRTSLLILTFL